MSALLRDLFDRAIDLAIARAEDLYQRGRDAFYLGARTRRAYQAIVSRKRPKTPNRSAHHE